MFKGIFTALITPFRNGKVNEKGLEEFVNWQIEQKIHGLIPCGTTGENLFLSHAEQKRIIEICVQASQGCVPVIAGTGAVSTEESILLAQQAKDSGADAILVVTPWYVNPSQESLFKHYKSIHDAVDIPLILYNNPTRTGVEISVELVTRLAQLKNIQGIKDSSCLLSRVMEIKTSASKDFSLFSGCDETFPAFLAMGGHGAISVAANVIPSYSVALYEAWEKNEEKEFCRLRDFIYPLISALSLESNPAPVKYAVSLIGKTSLETRLPFSSLTPETMDSIRNALIATGACRDPQINATPI